MVDIHQVACVRVLARLEEGMKPAITGVVKERATRGQPVPTGASSFLIVIFQGLGQMVMGDEPDIRLIDPHAKRVRRDDRFQLTLHEPLLIGRPIGGLQLAVIRGDHHSFRGQHLGQFVDRLDRGGINDARAFRLLHQPDESRALRVLTLNGNNPQLQVRSIKASVNDLSVGDVQATEDVFDHFGGRRGRQGEDRGMSESSAITSPTARGIPFGNRGPTG